MVMALSVSDVVSGSDLLIDWMITYDIKSQMVSI